MRVISTLIVSALALVVVPTMVSAARGEPYPGIVLTTIDATPVGNNFVEFSGNTPGKENDDSALVLKNVEDTGRKEGGYPVFRGEKVDVTELKASVKKPLLVIHGFRVQPQSILENCKKNMHKFKKFDLIPVIWPTTGGTRYQEDRGHSMEAGTALWSSMTKFAGMFPRKSLMAHSMGNRVLRHAAAADFKFDNIFMVGADVPRQIFNTDYINGDSNDWRRQDGLRISEMLNNAKSKIYCLHNVQDFALTGSRWVLNRGTRRLGAWGAEESDKLHPKLRERVENYNYGQKLNWTTRFAAHNYHWDDKAVEFYESKFI